MIGENDLVAIQRQSRFCSEYEIKISASDLRRDLAAISSAESGRCRGCSFSKFRKFYQYRARRLRLSEYGSPWIPNRFYFAVPAELEAKALTAPEWAGVVILDGSGAKPIRKAKAIHTNKPDTRNLLSLLSAAAHRTWRLRARV